MEEKREEVESISFNVEVTVQANGANATIGVPQELRLTPKIINYINEALESRGLKLNHMNITVDHQRDLEDIPNVVIEEEQKKED